MREEMYSWLNGPGAVFREPLPGSTNYLNAYDRDGQLIRMKNGRQARATKYDKGNGDAVSEESESLKKDSSHGPSPSIKGEMADDFIPFPQNRQFRSQPVLSEELKDEIWRRVVDLKRSVRTVSMDLNVEMSRVGAVVRLKAVEKQWVEQGKRLATPYASAILNMLPQTPFISGPYQPIHESINDLPVHRATETQTFYPVAESRQFTRRDAGRVFKRGLLPAEDRIPHPQLVELERLKLEGVPRVDGVIRQKMVEEEKEKEAFKEKMRQREERMVKKVLPGGDKGRYEFRFRNINVEQAGKTGRGRQGVGARYGLPAQDRKRGQIKIPTKVE
ncbi:hypothetical protein MMC22_005439 [Lobaria immixta]|nr:hypothetical protein [Lobaria immixta]